jgi:sugar lactone lactonase YvrE
LACDEGVGVFDPADGSVALRVHAEADRPANRSNDGKTDAEGRFWFGTMDDGEREDSGAVYRLDPDWSVTRVADGMGIPNTLTHTLDGETLILADSRQGALYACSVRSDGSLGERRLFAQVAPPGAPDGSALDAEGYLWNAQWGASRVVRYAPDGSIDRVVEMPVSQPSSCAFGGPRLDVLYVTSARVSLSEAELEREPLAGGVFAFEPGVSGCPVSPFAG